MNSGMNSEGRRAECGDESSARGGSDGAASSAVGERLQPFFDDLAALQSYALHYVAARSDALRQKVQKTIAWGLVGVLAALAGAAVIVTAAVVLVCGIAEGFAALFGGRAWAGDLLTGVLLLAILGGGAYFAVRSWLHASYNQMKDRYERRRQHEREAFGDDIASRAARAKSRLG